MTGGSVRARADRAGRVAPAGVTTAPPTGSPPGRPSRCARSSRRRSAPTGCCRARARPDRVRVRRQPVPADPAGGRDAARRRRRACGCLRSRARQRHPDRVPAGRDQPQRPGADRRHPGRRPPALAASAGARRTARAIRVAAWRSRSGASTGCWRGYGRKLGPDPASTDFACVGGVIANNSGGMRCGVHRRLLQHRPLDEVRARVGAVIDTAAAGAERGVRRGGAGAGRGLCRDPRRAARRRRAAPSASRRKFEIKNTTGYRLCAFLDADDAAGDLPPAGDRLRGDARVHRRGGVRDGPAAARARRSSLVPFEDIEAAAAAVPELVAAGAKATELMVAPTLIAAAYNMPGTPERVAGAAADRGGAAGRVPGRRTTTELDAARARPRCRSSPAGRWSRRRASRATGTRSRCVWRVREGMHGPARRRCAPPGVSLVIEDVCVPPARIAEAARDLQGLLGKHGFLPASPATHRPATCTSC